MTLERSALDDEYGVITTGADKLKVLFSETIDSTDPSAITVVKGIGSVYEYFIFVPRQTYEAILTVHNDALFTSSLIALSIRLLEDSSD